MEDEPTRQLIKQSRHGRRATGLVFSALCENPVCVAEAALQELYEHRIPGADTHERVLQLRALLPFFLRIALDAEHAVYEREVARAAAPLPGPWRLPRRSPRPTST